MKNHKLEKKIKKKKNFNLKKIKNKSFKFQFNSIYYYFNDDLVWLKYKPNHFSLILRRRLSFSSILPLFFLFIIMAVYLK